MSTIFALRTDGHKYKELDLQMRDIRRHRPDTVSLDDVLHFSVRNTPLSSWWKTPETEFISLTDPEAPIPDLSPGLYATLILSPKAYRLLGDALKPHGEMLPIIIDGETYFMFNCFTVGETDEGECHFDYVDSNGVKSGITHLEFKDSASEQLIFKTPAESCVSLFCNETFKEMVESFELTGITFDTNLIQIFD